MIQIRVKNLQEVGKKFERTKALIIKGSHTKPISTIAVKSIQANYKKRGRPTTWLPRKWNIYHDGSKWTTWHGAQWPLLDHTGRKRNTEERTAQTNWQRRAFQGWSLKIMTPVYGMAHHEGQEVINPVVLRMMRLPVRKSVSIQPNEVQQMKQSLKRFLLARWRNKTVV